MTDTGGAGMDSNKIWNYHQDVGVSELDVVGFDTATPAVMADFVRG